MIAGVYITVVLHHAGIATGRSRHTNRRRHTHPVGKDAVKCNDEYISDILPDPFIKDPDQEIAVI